MQSLGQGKTLIMIYFLCFGCRLHVGLLYCALLVYSYTKH